MSRGLFSVVFAISYAASVSSYELHGYLLDIMKKIDYEKSILFSYKTDKIYWL